MRELEIDAMLMALYETQCYMSAIEITVTHLFVLPFTIEEKE